MQDGGSSSRYWHIKRKKLVAGSRRFPLNTQVSTAAAVKSLYPKSLPPGQMAVRIVAWFLIATIMPRSIFSKKHCGKLRLGRAGAVRPLTEPGSVVACGEVVHKKDLGLDFL